MANVSQFFNLSLYPLKAGSETITGEWLFRHSSADQAALISDVTTSGATSTAQEWRRNNTAIAKLGQLLTLPSLSFPTSSQAFVIGHVDTSNYIVFDGGTDTITLFATQYLWALSRLVVSNLIDQVAVGADAAAPAAGFLRQYPFVANGITTSRTIDESSIITELSRDLFITVANTTGSTISRGKVVYILGGDGVNAPTIALADSTVTAKTPAIGFAVRDITNGSYGRILTRGQFANYNTSGFTAGDVLYLSTAGTVVNAMPAHPEYAQRVGRVTRSHASLGVIDVFVEDVHRDADGYAGGNYFQVGVSGTVGYKFYCGVGRTATLQTAATGNNTITIPNSTGTILFPNLTQTFTAQQTFQEPIIINKAIGTAPLTITSTTLCTNLNADLLDGKNTGTSGNTIPLLDGANTFSGATAFTAAVTGTTGTFELPTSMFMFRDDFTGNASNSGEATWASQTSGTGAAIAPAAGELHHPGIRTLTTGTQVSNYAGTIFRTTAYMAGGGWECTVILKVDTVAGCILRAAIHDSTTGADAVDGYYFELDDSISPNWQICCANNSTRTKTVSGSTPAVNTWYNLKVVVNSGNTSAEFFVDGASIGTVSTNLPATTRSTGVGIMYSNSAASATSKICSLDLVLVLNRNLTR